MNGYHLEDAAIDYLEQTPLSKMDANNVLDSIGIKLINGQDFTANNGTSVSLTNAVSTANTTIDFQLHGI